MTASPKNDPVRMLGLYEEDVKRFGKILRAMNLDNISDFASTIRQSGHRSTGNIPTQGLLQPCFMSCKVVYPPLCGSFHVVFPIEFADGVMWMLKISVNGDHFDSIAAAALVSEARTMQMLKRETSIPVPAVYAFDTSPNNALSCPFMLMEKLCGTPLSYQWFNSEVSKARLEHFRVKVLQSLAGVMVQLNKFTLCTGGALVFDPDGAPIGLGGAKVMDAVAEFNKAVAPQGHQEHQDPGGKNLAEETLVRLARSNAPKLSGGRQGDDDCSDDEDIIWERGPFSCPKAYFLSNLDRSDPAFRADAYERGTDMSLRLFIEWAFDESRNQDRRFVLTHPDLDVQNILVAEDGTVTGLIDWDGVAAAPREVGCAQYPLWLMRDWVPSRYRYDAEKGQSFADGYEESSPAELASYRALYAHFMDLEIEKMTGGPHKATTFGTLPKHEAKLTRRSLVMRSIDLSAGDPWAALCTVNHIIDQIEELTAPEWEDADSDTSSFTSCSSVNDSDSEDDEANDEAQSSETCEQALSGMRVDSSTHQEVEDLGGIEPGIPELDLKLKHTSLGVAEQKQVSPSSSDVCPPEVEELKMQDLSKLDLPDGISTASGPLCSMRRLLRIGCDATKEYLQKIAKIGYTLEYAVDKLAEVLPDAQTRHRESSAESTSGLVVESDTPHQMIATAIHCCVRTKSFEDTQSTRDTVGPEVLRNARPLESTAGQVSSLQPAVQPEQTKTTPTTVETQDIPARKEELRQAARKEKKAEKKAIYRADKAAIKEELKVWERIALCVWSRGTSLKQLQKTQFKIARWVVDLLQEEQEHEDRLLSPHQVPSAAETTAANRADSGVITSDSLEEDFVLSKEESEDAERAEDLLHAAKVDRDEPSDTIKTTDASTAENGGLQSKTHQMYAKKPFSEVQDVPELKISPPEIFGDNNNEPASSTAIPSSIQPHARSSPTKNCETSKKSFVGAQKTRKSAAPGNDKMVPALRNNTPQLELSTETTLIKDHSPVDKPAMPFHGLETASGLHLGRKNTTDDQGAAWNLTNSTEVQQMPGSYPDFEDDDVLQYAKATHHFKALCESWTSYFTQVIYDRNHFQLDKEPLSAASSVTSDTGDEENGSDIGGAQSSATSLSDGQAGDENNEEIKEAKEDTLGGAVTTTGEGGSGEEEDDAEADEGKFEGKRMRNAEAKMDLHNFAAFTATSSSEEAPRKVYDPCSGEWAEANKFDEVIKAGKTAATNDQVHQGEAIETGDSECEGEKENDDDKENRFGEDEVDETSSDSESPEFEDNGRFEPYTICNLLGMGELDELRLLRLKEGFLKLLEQC